MLEITPISYKSSGWQERTNSISMKLTQVENYDADHFKPHTLLQVSVPLYWTQWELQRWFPKNLQYRPQIHVL